MIVICSPNSAKSQWVNEEVKAFKKLGKQNRILCLIVDGEPNADSKPEMGLEECFPPAVKVAADEEGNLTDIQSEPIAADAREGKDGKANAMMKVLAGLLGVGFDEIKQRDLVRKQKRAAVMVAGESAPASAFSSEGVPLGAPPTVRRMISRICRAAARSATPSTAHREGRWAVPSVPSALLEASSAAAARATAWSSSAR